MRTAAQQLDRQEPALSISAGEVQPWRGMMKALLQSEVRYHLAVQELPQLFYLLVSSSVSPAITHGGHTLPQRPES